MIIFRYRDQIRHHFNISVGVGIYGLAAKKWDR